MVDLNLVVENHQVRGALIDKAQNNVVYLFRLMVIYIFNIYKHITYIYIFSVTFIQSLISVAPHTDSNKGCGDLNSHDKDAFLPSKFELFRCLV